MSLSEHMSFRPIVSHGWLGYIMWMGFQMRLESSPKQSISLSSTRAGPNSMSQVPATRWASWDTPGLWSTTPTSTGTQAKSNWYAAQITAGKPKVIAVAQNITSQWHLDPGRNDIRHFRKDTCDNHDLYMTCRGSEGRHPCCQTQGDATETIPWFLGHIL